MRTDVIGWVVGYCFANDKTKLANYISGSVYCSYTMIANMRTMYCDIMYMYEKCTFVLYLYFSPY